MEFSDKQITCIECQQPFTFTAGEQRWYKERGFEREPRRCPECRKARKAREGDGGERDFGGGGGGRGRGGDRPRYQATCAQCGGVAELPFQPRPGSPVYCSTCYQARRA